MKLDIPCKTFNTFFWLFFKFKFLDNHNVSIYSSDQCIGFWVYSAYTTFSQQGQNIDQ